jgi:hypothetical protein
MAVAYWHRQTLRPLMDVLTAVLAIAGHYDVLGALCGEVDVELAPDCGTWIAGSTT